MKVLEPKELEKRRQTRTNKQKKSARKKSAVPVILVVMVVYGIAALLVPLPAIQAETKAPSPPPAGSVSMPWPAYGEQAIGAVGYGLLTQNGEQKQLPIASVAKVITVLAVLKAHPLHPGEKGELITITKKDVDMYKNYLAQGQSVIKVEAGEQITLYQALQAVLLPSANNMAEILADWAFGSTQEYLDFVNSFTDSLGMPNTVIADASGFSPETKSTASDLAVMAEIAMNQPVIAEIVGQTQADLPVAGTVYNVNNQLGKNGIVGIKTGNTDEAGGVYLFAATRKIEDSKSVTVVGAIMGSPNLYTAIQDSLPLLDETFKNFKSVKPVESDQVVGSLSQKGGSSVTIVARQAVSVVLWAGQQPRIDLIMSPISTTVQAGDQVGVIQLGVGNMSYEIPLLASGSLSGHSLFWRVKHGGGYF